MFHIDPWDDPTKAGRKRKGTPSQREIDEVKKWLEDSPWAAMREQLAKAGVIVGGKNTDGREGRTTRATGGRQ